MSGSLQLLASAASKKVFLFSVLLLCLLPHLASASDDGAITRHYEFNVISFHCGMTRVFIISFPLAFLFFTYCHWFSKQVRLQNVTRLCHTRSVVTVNGKFPGPRIVAREGDRLLIKVINHVPNNISIHWYIPNYRATDILYDNRINSGTSFLTKFFMKQAWN